MMAFAILKIEKALSWNLTPSRTAKRWFSSFDLITVRTVSKFADGYFLSRIANMMTIIRPSISTSTLANVSMIIIPSATDKSIPPFCRFAVHFHGHHLRSETWNHRLKLSYTYLFENIPSFPFFDSNLSCKIG